MSTSPQPAPDDESGDETFVAVGMERPHADGPLTVVVSRPSVILDPSRLIRIAWTASALLEDLPRGPLDAPTRRRLTVAWAGLAADLAAAVSAEAMDELHELLPLEPDNLPSADELRVLHAQLVGWLKGLLVGEELSMWGAAVAGEQGLADLLSARWPPEQRPPGSGPPKWPSAYL